jgi:ATP-dependent Zn protease
MNNTVKTVVFWLVILFAALALWQVVKNGNSTKHIPEISYSQFLSKADSGEIVRIRISKLRATGTDRDGNWFRVIIPSSQEQMLQLLRQRNVEIWYADISDDPVSTWLVNILGPVALLAALWYFMMRQIRPAQGRRATMGDSPLSS